MARATVSTTIDRIRRQLSSGYRNEINVLTSAVNTTTTTFPLVLPITPNIIPGALLSIGIELCRVITVDTTTNAVTVLRGFHDSEPANHDAGDEVWINSRFTGLDIYDALLEEIASYGPQLYSVATEEVTVSDGQEVVELPASLVGLYGLIDVHRQWTDTSSGITNQAWPRANVRLVRYDPAVWSAFSTSGLALRIIDPVAAGKLIIKAAMPYHTSFTLGQSFVLHGGLQESMLDVLSLGVRLRLLHDGEASATGRTVQDEPRRAQEVPVGSTVQSNQLAQALYRNRKMEEINKLRAANPIRFG